MTALLDRAFTPEAPGAPLPPGPRSNDWARLGATSVPEASREAGLLDELWGPRGVHRHEDGRPTSVPRRLVPSAGGAYPVQWHLVVPRRTGSSLPPGRYARDGSGALLRRSGPLPAGRRVTLVVTVQPGRSFGRYRHRAWPLWVADAAYAVEAVRALVPSARLPGAWADLDAARDLLALPRASETGWWLERGLAPELCLARVELPGDWEIAQLLSRLRRRRSPTPATFARTAQEPGPRPPVPAAREVAAQSGQSWVLGADRVVAWPRPESATGASAYAMLWQAHRRAAHLCYRLAGQRVASRPVSGFTLPPRAGARPLLHALAVLDPKEHPA
jgi:hypothetical protein